MARERRITAHFSDGRRYFENDLGREFDYTQSTGPYEYLLGALAGCFYLTLISFPHDSRWNGMDISVSGIKRDEIPTTLKHTTLSIKVHGADDEQEVLSLIEKAKAECSVYATISKVSEIEVLTEFD